MPDEERPGAGPNCILAVCCPPDSDGQVEALAGEIEGHVDLGEPRDTTEAQVAHNVAAWVVETYDLAPKGSLQAFKDAIRDYAREGYVEARPPEAG